MGRESLEKWFMKHKAMLLVGLSNLLFFFLTFGLLLLNPQYSVDCFELLVNGYGSLIEFCVQHGRWSGALLRYALQALSINVVQWQPIFYGLWIILASSALTLMTFTYKKIAGITNIFGIFGIDVVLAISFANVFCAHLLMYPEMAFDFAIGIFCVTGAAAVLLLEVKNRIVSILVSLFLILMALGLYQGLLGIFVSFCLFGCVLQSFESSLKKSVLVKLLISLVVAGIAAACVSVLFPRFAYLAGFASPAGADYLSATLSLDVLSSNAVSLLGLLPTIFFDAFYFLPTPIMVGFLTCLVVALVVVMTRQSAKMNLLIVGSVLISLCAVFAPHLVNASFWVTGRSVLPLWSVYSGIGCVVFAAFVRSGAKWMDLGGRLVVLLFALMVLVSSLYCRDMLYESGSMSRKELSEGTQIAEAIKSYELQESTSVTKIGFLNDASVTWVSQGAHRASPDYVIRPLSTKWCSLAFIEFVSNRTFEEVDVPNSINNEFALHDWSSLNTCEQLVFDGDTVYLCAY